MDPMDRNAFRILFREALRDGALRQELYAAIREDVDRSIRDSLLIDVNDEPQLHDPYAKIVEGMVGSNGVVQYCVNASGEMSALQERIERLDALVEALVEKRMKRKDRVRVMDRYAAQPLSALVAVETAAAQFTAANPQSRAVVVKESGERLMNLQHICSWKWPDGVPLELGGTVDNVRRKLMKSRYAYKLTAAEGHEIGCPTAETRRFGVRLVRKGMLESVL